MNVEGEWRDGFRSFTDHQLEILEKLRMVNAKSLVASGSETRLSIGDRRHRIASYGQMWSVIKRNWTSNMHEIHVSGPDRLGYVLITCIGTTSYDRPVTIELDLSRNQALALANALENAVSSIKIE